MDVVKRVDLESLKLPHITDYEIKIKSYSKMPLPENVFPRNPDEVAKVLADHAEWISSVADQDSEIKGIRALLSGADLRGFDFSGADLRAADFSNSNLEGADFSSADLSLATFGGANLRNAWLRKSVLVQADMYGADTKGADMEDAIFEP